MREYNYEGSSLRKSQLEMLEALKVFAQICKEHDIKWWLCSGTLLGAARHKGFIPWDDDADVSMMKEDYMKLEKILVKMNDEKYFYQCTKTDPEYVNFFGKFRKKTDPLTSNDPREQHYRYNGPGFDIFCIEKSSRFAAHMAKFFYHNMQYPTQHIRNKGFRRFMIGLVKALNRGIFIPLTRMVGLVNPKKQYHYLLGSGFYKSAFYKEDIFPLSTMEFEGVEFPVPGNTDAYLTKIYGDWHKLPSEEQIRKTLHCPAYIKEIFGDE